MLRVLVVALVALVAAMFLLPRDVGPPSAATLLTEPWVLPEIRLTDQTGQDFGLERLRGTYTLMFFGSMNAPDWRPTTLAAVRQTVAARAPEAVPQLLFVSLDPDHDARKRLAAYLLGLNPAFVGATASKAELEPWLEALEIGVRREREGSATLAADPAVYVVGPDGAVLAIVSAPTDPATFASDLLKIRRRWRAAHGHRAPA